MAQYGDQYGSGQPPYDQTAGGNMGERMGGYDHGTKTHGMSGGEQQMQQQFGQSEQRYGHTGGNLGGYGTTAIGATPGMGRPHGGEYQQHGQSEKIHRTDGGSSSSSEDDGQGGRRKKKGLTEKIKEKIPGFGHKEQPEGTTTTTTATTMFGGESYGREGENVEKAGWMDRIKEKAPGF